MVHHDNWVHHLIDMLGTYIWKHRILLYIAFILTLILLVEMFELSFVGK